MTEATGSNRNTMIIAVVALLLVAGIAIWATTRHQPAATVSGSAPAGDKDADVNLKVNLPDSVTIDAH